MGERKWLDIAKALFLLITYSVMFCGVVIEGILIPDYQYSFSFITCIFYIIVYLVCHLIQHGFEPSWWNRETFSVENCGLIAFFWACNYTFLLFANPYVAGVVQVILGEMNILGVVLWARLLHHQRYHWLQYVAVVIVLVAGLFQIFAPGVTTKADATSSAPMWLWSVFFLVGSSAIGLANIRTERVLKSDKLEDNKISLFLFFAAVNVYAAFFVMAFFWVPGMAIGSVFWDNFREGLIVILSFDSAGSLWVWFTMSISTVSTVLQGMISRDEDATYSTIITTVAPFLSAIFMGLYPWFDQKLNWTVWACLFVSLIGTALYKIVALRMSRAEAESHYVPSEKRKLLN